MKWVEPRVYLIAHTVPDHLVAAEWLRDIGFDIENEFDPRIDSRSSLSGPEELIAWAGKRCYLSFDTTVNPNLTRVREDWTEYLENILKSAHGSVLEHASFTFAIEGVSRVLTGELNRHRAGVAISEGSMRYIRYNPDEGLPMVDTPFFDQLETLPLNDLLYKKILETRLVFEDAADILFSKYQKLNEIWAEELAPGSTFHQKKVLTSLFRRILPMGIATGGVWTFNLRALRHIIAMRATEGAEEEICLVAFKIAMLASSILEVGLRDFEVVDDKYLKPLYWKV